jgi:rhamnulokinase
LPNVHIIGGGSRNRLLNQFTASATGRTVIAGPAEATAIGNLLVQALALGHLGSLAEGRELVRRSFALSTFEPGDQAAWDAAYQTYLQLST